MRRVSVMMLALLSLVATAAGQDSTPIACRADDASGAHVRTFERWMDDVWARGHLDLVSSLVRPVYVRHELDSTRSVTAAAYAAEIASVRRALPGVRFEIHDCAASGDRLWVRWTMLGVSASSGAAIRRMGMQVYRFEGGRLAETWVLMPPTDGVWPESRTVVPSSGAAPRE